MLSIWDQNSLILAGDFNVDFCEKTSRSDRLLNLLGSFVLHLTITEPPRIALKSSTCID